ncbi:MAG TPA: hypothetical protein VK694_00210 [Verrucomicrobiae bacterium]|nr:hypothetical protein [Verrucomicrobiae bacterium]
MAINIDVLEITIKELQRKYDKICHDFDGVRVKILTLIGGGLVFLSFLYAGDNNGGMGDIFFPSKLDSQIFYAIGLGSFLGALCVLFWAMRSTTWALPIDQKELAKLEERYNSKGKFLVFLLEEYNEAYAFCKQQHLKKVALLDIGTNMLFIGAIILLVLRYFGS